jgi:protoporphyrinogen oxidase
MTIEAADVIVLGAGVAGLTATHTLLQETGDILCLETFDHVGGNHRSRNIGEYSFDIGSIVLDANAPLFSYFVGLRDLCVPFNMAIQRVAPRGRVRAYPFEIREAFGGNFFAAMANASSLLAGRLSRRAPKNVEDYCIHVIGRRLYEELGLKIYVERFHGLPADAIDVRFAEQRMQFVAKGARPDQIAAAIVRASRNWLAGRSEERASFAALVRPRAGFEALYGAVRDHLVQRGARFIFSVAPRTIRKCNGRFEIDTDRGVFSARRVVSTLPVNTILPLIGARTEDALLSSNLLTLFVSFSGARGFAAPILYNFDSAGYWKRLTMHSDAYGRVNAREYFSLEFPFTATGPPKCEDAFRHFRDHVQRSGIFAGDLALEGSELTRNAYPVYTLGSDEVLRRAMRTIEDFGIGTIGRQGRFDYLPTVGRVMTQVEQQLRPAPRTPSELSNHPEADRTDPKKV